MPRRKKGPLQRPPPEQEESRTETVGRPRRTGRPAMATVPEVDMADHISISSDSSTGAKEPGEISASNSGGGDSRRGSNADAIPLPSSMNPHNNAPRSRRSEYPLAAVTFAKRDRRMIKALMDREGISSEEARKRHCQRYIDDMHSTKRKRFQIRFGRKWKLREAELKQTAGGFVVTALPKPRTGAAQAEPGEVVDLVSDDDLPQRPDHEDPRSDPEEQGDDDYPAQMDTDYGSLARDAATRSTTRLQNATRIADLDDFDRDLQVRYFNVTNPDAPVRCLSCGKPSHMQMSCPSNVCEHCGSHRHFSRACPNHRKCERCRQRGHPSDTCRNRFVQGGGFDDPCDVCGQRGHVEEECTRLWRSFTADESTTLKFERSMMKIACYNCGASTHWGDDCPDLPDYLRDRGKGLWTAREAEKYVLGEVAGIDGREQECGRENSGGNYENAEYGDRYDDAYDQESGGGGRGGYGGYQSYAFDDARD